MADQPLEEVPKVSETCQVCSRNTADFYCECSGSKVPTCREFQHCPVPTETAAVYQARSQAFIAGKAELLRNLATIDQCCHDLTAVVETMVQTLNQYLADQLSHLRTVKATLEADIEESVREVERTLTEREVHYRGKYSAYLRDHEPGGLVLFRYRLDPNLVHFCQVHLPTFTLHEPTQVLQLVRLKGWQVDTFDFQTETWGAAVRLSKVFSEYSVYTAVDASRLFCCGNKSTENWLIDFSSAQVEQLSLLKVPRHYPGLLHHEGELFVLGNWNKGSPGRDVEMLRLTDRQWTRQPDMNAGRCSFTPCVYRDNAYLCTGKDTSIDILDLETHQFLPPLPITLPAEANSHSVTVAVGDELVIINISNTTVQSLVRPVRSSRKHSAFMSGPASTPVKHADRVYWVDYSGNCVRASGKHWEVVEVVRN